MKTKVALLFPGQGSQSVGMGKDFFDACEPAKQVFEKANQVLDFDLAKLCFEGPKEALQLTENTQPAILATSIAMYRSLDFWDRVDSTVCAGHSLGEYSAAVAAGSMKLEDALTLVRKRGELMQSAVPVGEGAMAAILKASKATIEAVCKQVDGVVEAVNYNCPGQIVIAGETEAVKKASQLLKEQGARALPLPVSAPFHSRLMEPAEQALKPYLENVQITSSKYLLFRNVDANPVTEAEDICDGLIRQVSRPVQWEDTIRAMLNVEVNLFLEIGPGKVLTGLVNRIEPKAKALSIAKIGDLETAKNVISNHMNHS